jgi:hypothetical protein
MRTNGTHSYYSKVLTVCPLFKNTNVSDEVDNQNTPFQSSSAPESASLWTLYEDQFNIVIRIIAILLPVCRGEECSQHTDVLTRVG